MTTASEILAALRMKYSDAAVVHEVVMTDPVEEAIRRRDLIDRYPDSPHYAKAFDGLPVADAVPEGWSRRGSVPTRRIDALILTGKETTAVEIKVTRADFRRESSEKRRAWMSVANRFVYAAPAGVIPKEELPQGCGLWEFEPVGDDVPRWVPRHGLTTVVRAKVNKTPDPLPRQVLVAFAYRLSRREAAA